MIHFFFSLFPELRDKSSVLDLACGNGYIAKLLKSQNGSLNITAIDTHRMLSQGWTHSNEKVDRVAAVAQMLPLANGSHDFIFSSMLFHWAEDAEQIASEIYRVLKPGGTTVISLANPRYFKTGTYEGMDTEHPRFVRSVDSDKSQQLQVMLSNTVGPLTYYLRPVDLYRDMLMESGFSAIEFFEPTMNDPSLLDKHDFLKKYKEHPLYLFIKARKDHD